MGILDRIIGGANTAYDKVTDAEYALVRDRRYDAADRLSEHGDGTLGVITGIRGRWNDSTTELVFRVEWNDGNLRSGAIQLGAGAAASLRIGSEVLVRTDGGRVALDVDGMASAPLASDVPGLHHRKVPDIGVDDTALDMRVLSHLKKWTPARAVVQSWSRCSTLGMVTDNWDVVLTLADGTTATDVKDAVPTYARWFVVLGADVPVVVDPKHTDKVQVDWPRLAEERAGGQWDDPVPEGSIAAARFAGRAAQPQSTVTFGAQPEPTPPGEQQDPQRER